MRYFKKLFTIIIFFSIGILISEFLLFLISEVSIEKRDTKPLKDTKIILCIGDSYTYGGEVENKDSYPYILSRAIRKYGFTVVNKGRCEADTSDIIEQYQNFLKEVKPQKVIFLGGTANFFGYKTPPKILGEKLRTFKLINIFLTNLKANLISTNYDIYSNFTPFEIDPNKEYSKNEENYYTKKVILFKNEERNFNKAYEMVQEGLKKFPQSINLRWLLINLNFKLNKYEANEREIEAFKNLILNENNYLFSKSKGIIIKGLGEWDLIKYDFDNASQKMIQALKYLESLTPYDVYIIKQAFSMQSSISVDEIQRKLIDISNTNFKLASDKNFRKLTHYFKRFKKNEEGRVKWIKSDIKKIIDISQKNEIELYIMTYPYPYKKVNEILREIAYKHKIKLIDSEKYFDKLSNREKIKYFKDSDHLSAKGNEYLSKIILENIF